MFPQLLKDSEITRKEEDVVGGHFRDGWSKSFNAVAATEEFLVVRRSSILGS
jgi:hypothetical protein